MDQTHHTARIWQKERGAAAARRACWLAIALLCGPPAWAQGRVTRFHLPAEPFPQAILDFYHQSGIQAMYAATPQVAKLKTRAVSGMMDGAAALSRMLAGTGLTFVFDTDHSVIIRPGAAPAPARQAVALRPRTGRRRPQPSSGGTGRLLPQVEVTGSLIHGAQGDRVPLLYIKREQLTQAPYATVQDALYELPLVSMNGPREDLRVNNNYQDGAGINLRGLGVGATLVLVDGRRQPLGGLTGDFVDVSTIPWSAVERIEVLPDGASALYGSDAVAGVVNIIMRDSFNGAETQARYGTARDGRAELMVAQLLGDSWTNGHVMFDYQFSDATPLAAAARPYAANANKTPYGGGDYDSYYSNPGNILDPLTQQPAFGIPSGQNGVGLAVAQLSPTVNLQNQFADMQIFPERVAHEFYSAASENVTDALELFARARYAQRDTQLRGLPDEQTLFVPSTNAFYVNPYAGVPYTLIAYSFQSDFGPTQFSSRSRVYMGTLGGTLHLAHDWRLTLSESDGNQSLVDNEYDVPDPLQLATALADPNPATAFDPVAAGSYTNAAVLATINRDFLLHSSDGTEATELVADGSLLRLPAGEAKLAVGVERRTETLDHDVPDPADPEEHTVAQRYGRHVLSLFSQLALPLLGASQHPGGPARLMLNLAGRYEHYSDFGGTFNPTVRLVWTASRWLTLRGSWDRSFRAPELDDLYDTSQDLSALVVLADPHSATGRSLVLAEQGSNPDLRQETARTSTLGAGLTPWDGLRLSLTYYTIDYFNRIGQPAADDPLGVLEHASEWASVITRNPSQTQIAAICDSPEYIGSVSECLASNPAAIVDLRLANLSATRTSGLDLDAHQRLESLWGQFEIGLQGNYVFRFLQSVTPTSPAVSILDTVGNPLSLRLRATAGWSRRGLQQQGWSFHVALNYTGAYRDPTSLRLPTVPAWTTVDAQASYRMAGVLRGGATTLSLNAVNVFNHDPPFVDSEFGYDVANVQPLGRVLSLALTENW